MYLNRMNILFKRRFSTHFSKADRHLHPCTLLCRVTVNGIAASEFSTGQRLLPHHWDQATQQALPDCPDAGRINEALATLRRRLTVLWNRYEYEEIPVTADQLTQEYLNRKQLARAGANHQPVPKQPRPVKPPKAGYSFAQLLADHLSELRRQVDAGLIVLETWKVYRRYTNNILRYVAATASQQRPILYAPEIDLPWMDGLVRFMQVAGYDGYYTAKHQYFVKTAFDWAVGQKHIVYNPVSTYDVDRADTDAELVFLYEHELERLAGTDFRAFVSVAHLAPALDRVRDAFVAMCEIGQHYHDYKLFVRTPDQFLREVKGHQFFRKRR